MDRETLELAVSRQHLAHRLETGHVRFVEIRGVLQLGQAAPSHLLDHERHAGHLRCWFLAVIVPPLPWQATDGSAARTHWGEASAASPLSDFCAKPVALSYPQGAGV